MKRLQEAADQIKNGDSAASLTTPRETEARFMSVRTQKRSKRGKSLTNGNNLCFTGATPRKNLPTTAILPKRVLMTGQQRRRQ